MRGSVIVANAGSLALDMVVLIASGEACSDELAIQVALG